MTPPRAVNDVRSIQNQNHAPPAPHGGLRRTEKTRVFGNEGEFLFFFFEGVFLNLSNLFFFSFPSFFSFLSFFFLFLF